MLCETSGSKVNQRWAEPSPPATAAINASIQLFAQLLPMQDSSLTTKIISQIVESTRSPKFEKNAGRKAAVSINAAVALVLALRRTITPQSRNALGDSQVASLLNTFLKVSGSFFYLRGPLNPVSLGCTG